MVKGLLTTKLFLPQPRPGLVPRTHLIQRLEEGRDRKFTLISAPAGFGKTTLLAEWITTKNTTAQTAWVSLDAADNELTRFWTYIFTALRNFYPDIASSILEALESSQTPHIDWLLTDFINKFTADPKSLLLVLDDLQSITNNQIHESIAFFLDHMPPQIHLVVSSRTDPPWPLALRRVNGEMNELRAVDLRFTKDECAIFLNQTMQLDLSADLVETLDERTEGWIAGLQMAALSMSDREEVEDFIQSFSGSNRYIFDYLVEEVLDRQPAEVAEFLLMTSVLERFNASLCAAILDAQTSIPISKVSLTGEISNQNMLEYLDKSNLFLVNLDDERQWFRYHHLFAELLRARLDQLHPGLSLLLHQKASTWYQDKGLVDEAIYHAFKGEDQERVADLVEANGMQMIVDSQVSRLSGWLEALPEIIVQRRPWLCIFNAWVRYYLGPREQVEHCLTDSEKTLETGLKAKDGEISDEEQKHLRGQIAAIRAYLALQNQELGLAGIFANQAMDLLPEDDYGRGTSAIALAETHRQEGNLAAMEMAYKEARLIAEKCNNMPMAVSALAYMAYQQAKQGKLYEAIETNQAALDLAVYPDGRYAPAAGLPYVKMGDVLREVDDLENAKRCLKEGIRLCRLWGHADSLVNGYTHLARVHLAQGDLVGVRDNLDQAKELTQRTTIDPWAICWYDDCRLRLWLAEGDFDAALTWAKNSGLKIDGALSYVRDLDHVNLARVLIAQWTHKPSRNDLDNVLALLDRLLSASQAVGWLNRSLDVLILRALALQALGRSDAALEPLEEALSLAEPSGYINIFLDEGPSLEYLLRQLLQNNRKTEYIKILLDASKQHQINQQATIRTTHNNGRSSPPQIESLTQREEQVFNLLTTELSVPDIAEELGVSVTTVRTHIRHIFDKLDVHSRYEAVIKRRNLL